MKLLYTLIPLAPLLAAIVTGLFGRRIGRDNAHRVTIAGVAFSLLLSVYAFFHVVVGEAAPFNETLYTWLVSGNIKFEIGFLVDNLTVMMLLVVNFVSLMVHIYTIGYMHDDDGYQRFFSYISLFTFSMLMLVMSNNFLQLFFGWEAVGTVSYLLIGFYYKKETAIFANMKAFLVNRVGDFGFVLGIAGIVMYTNSLAYTDAFAAAPGLVGQTINIVGSSEWDVLTVLCILLFIGAMGKSAQAPLHVWLPDSMEGPTPISALIHAATMVTAGIFMVSRMSPLFELSETALSFILIIGAFTAFFMGLIGMVQNDIKRVIAYSTLSQLGYMTVALGVSAYSAAMFHLMTHAFFKALLFLAAGSVIIAMHHEQDIRKMGGLRKIMPTTYWTSLIGSLALIGFPAFSGFYSKDIIIEAVHASSIPGAHIAYWAVLGGVFVTAFYSFRLFFLVFHGKTRMDKHTEEHAKESPKVVTVPLILLAIPSLIIGALTVTAVVYGDYFKDVIYVAPEHAVLEQLGEEYHGPLQFIIHAFNAPAVYIAAVGVATAFLFYILAPSIPTFLDSKLGFLRRILDNKYGFDDFNQAVFARGSVALGRQLWQKGDIKVIDGALVNGAANSVGWLAGISRNIQSGMLFHYAFAMILGLLAMLTWFLFV
ncbi:NADH-quinone oxidoreductase subunit L [Granulosicoccus antarcticus]|uniref:NADH-quinone oxidoreductase subunit L n=1 Tax=Granulosicoccus antarcticus IMCC3135 TaxID=1192854 RepID=A0A2Z2NP57_9GAMM|nr:NADH-quinone oxidoreductase subunit L [Granulosicoccus antarcticus]ASJ72315.1 NADH-quinone oxidoreductase subunit L [Granulosicoccus antarcticus IMCC3135]